METPIKITKQLEAKYRRLRRFIESDAFQYFWGSTKRYKSINNKTVEIDKIIFMIKQGRLEDLKELVYKNNPLVDAPLRWLRRKASQNNITNYSRKTKVQLVDELSRILK